MTALKKAACLACAIAAVTAAGAAEYRYVSADGSGDLADKTRWNTVSDGSGAQLTSFSDATLVVNGTTSGGNGQNTVYNLTLSEDVTAYDLKFYLGAGSVVDLGGHTLTLVNGGNNRWYQQSAAGKSNPPVIQNGTFLAPFHRLHGALRVSGAGTLMKITNTNMQGWNEANSFFSVTDGAQFKVAGRMWFPASGDNLAVEVAGAGSRIDVAAEDGGNGRCDTRKAGFNLTARDGGVFKCVLYVLMDAAASGAKFTADGGTVEIGSLQLNSANVKNVDLTAKGTGLLTFNSFVNQNSGTKLNFTVTDAEVSDAGAMMVLNAAGGSSATTMYATTVINVTAGGDVATALAGRTLKIIEDKAGKIVWQSGATVNLGPDFTLVSQDANGLVVKVKPRADLTFKGIDGADMAAAASWKHTADGSEVEADELNGNETVNFADNADKTAYRATLSGDMEVRLLKRNAASHETVTFDLGGHTLKSQLGLEMDRPLVITNGVVDVTRGQNCSVGYSAELTVAQDGKLFCTNYVAGTFYLSVGSGGASYVVKDNGEMKMGGNSCFRSAAMLIRGQDDARIGFANTTHVGAGDRIEARDRSEIAFTTAYHDAGNVTWSATNGTIRIGSVYYPSGGGSASWAPITVNLAGTTPRFELNSAFAPKPGWTFNFALGEEAYADTPVTVNGDFTLTTGAINVTYPRELKRHGSRTVALIEVPEGNTLTLGADVTITKSFPRDKSSVVVTARGVYLDVVDDSGTVIIVR